MSVSKGNELGSKNVAFLSVQLVLLLGVVGWAAYRSQQLRAERALPPLLDVPLDVPPLYDYDFVVTDDQLSRALTKIRPRFQGRDTKIFHVDHNLRSWTPQAKFVGDEFMSGEDMLRLLTDHRRFVEVFGEEVEPLLVETEGGVHVRDREGNRSSSHHDHTLACLAEVGVPLDHPIITPTRQTTFRAILEDSLRTFSINQQEYEWSALAYVLFLPPISEWVTTEGQHVSFDFLAERIMREALPQGVCAANHRLHALVMFLRVDDRMRSEGQDPILSPETRQRIIAYLQDITATLVRNQHPDGFWNRNWNSERPASSTPTDKVGDELGDRIIATGHVMEWLALAPEEIHPPRAVLIAAGQWLVKTIDELSPKQVDDYQSFLSHTGRALALWRGRTPAEVQLLQDAPSPAAAAPEAETAPATEAASPSGAEPAASSEPTNPGAEVDAAADPLADPPAEAPILDEERAGVSP